MEVRALQSNKASLKKLAFFFPFLFSSYLYPIPISFSMNSCYQFLFLFHHFFVRAAVHFNWGFSRSQRTTNKHFSYKKIILKMISIRLSSVSSVLCILVISVISLFLVSPTLAAANPASTASIHGRIKPVDSLLPKVSDLRPSTRVVLDDGKSYATLIRPDGSFVM